MKLWQLPFFEWFRQEVDATALAGASIARAGLESRLFDANPRSHSGDLGKSLQDLYDLLAKSAAADGRLIDGRSLITQWRLSYDVFSPKLQRFIEIDERQHFSAVRNLRIALCREREGLARYPDVFWSTHFAKIQMHPSRDLDPPYRDEQRAYRDEARELLPIGYGLQPTLRLDEFSLASYESGWGMFIRELLGEEK